MNDFNSFDGINGINPDPAEAMDALDMVAEFMIGLRRRLIDGGFSEPVAEMIVLQMNSLSQDSPSLPSSKDE